MWRIRNRQLLRRYIYIYRERERERERDVVADIKKEETRIDWTYSMNGLGKES